MKVLFFTYDFPYPTNSGGKVRAYNLLKQKDNDVEIILVSFVRPGFKNEYTDHMKRLDIEKIFLFPRRKVKDIRNISAIIHKEHSLFYYLYFREEVKRTLYKIVREENVDVIHFESFYTGYYIDEIYQTKQIFGTENIESLLYKDYISFNVSSLVKPFYMHQLKKIEHEEMQMFRNADKTLTVTEEEGEYIKKISQKDSFVIENGVDLNKFRYVKKKEKELKNLLFVGNFSYFPNKDAMQFIIDNMFKKFDDPSVLFTIIGKGARRLPIRQENVRCIEFAEDIVDAYSKADVFLSPVRIGGGTNFKVLEAMASGIPVIAFPDRAHALGVENMKHMVLAGKDDFYSSLQKLLQDRKLREKIAKNARELIERKFSWDVIGKKMNTVWKM